MLMTRLLARLTLCLAALAAPAAAQNIFAPVIEVNEDVITGYELQQRLAFLEVVSPLAASEERARESLIEDRLRQQAVAQFGLTATEDQVLAAMTEFAARGGLELEQFLNVLSEQNISEQTFRDFVSVGIGWRDLIRGRFGNRVEVTEADIDRAVAASTQGSALRVLLSEIIIPAPPEELEAVLALARQISETTSFAVFSDAAQQFSATASRDRGGRLDWTPITDLPEPLRPLLLSLTPGEVTDPIPLENAVALFQLRDIQETERPAPTFEAIEFARLFIPGGRSEAALAEAARVAAEVDTCDDLYGVAFGDPEEVLQRDTLAPAEIPNQIALELAKLDENEVSTALVSTDGTSLVFLMLCGRTAAIAGEEINREAVANQLRQERFTGFADSYLEQLRADARIRDK
jgi:peptidyl-prolyl cis-trans isomerase SurA